MTDVSERTAGLPFLRFICGRAIDLGPNSWRMGLYWHPNPNPQPGQLVYKHGIVLMFSIYIWFDRF